VAIFGRKRQPAQPLRIRTLQSAEGRSSLVAASYRIPMTGPDSRKEAARQMRLRQGWQLSAWGFRDQIPEARYAFNYLAHCAARMKLFPAAFPLQGETDNPVALGELEETVPAEVIVACAQAMMDLGNGRRSLSQVMHKLSTNKSVAGECWLLGMTDPQTSIEEWSIRSITEIAIKDDKYFLREVPSDNQGVLGAIELDPETTVLSRMWTPHPQWEILADSPMRALQETCESLAIYRRMIRAHGRSRIAGNGLLLVPEEITLKSPNGDNSDPEADDFLGQLGEMMMMPLDNEGAASAVVPGLIRASGEFLDKIRHLPLSTPLDERAAAIREELLGEFATGVDLPKEVILGTVDLNHWSAWQVDDNTFRHHVEPHVINLCDSLTGGFLRPYLEDAGIDPLWADRIVLWYDPVELVTHPDRTADSAKAYEDMVISAEARRRESGFSEEDAPTIQELEMRRVMDIRALPLNLLMEYASRADPTLVVPPMTGPPQLPGIKPGGGVDVGATVAPPGATTPPTLDVGPPAAQTPTPAAPGPPPEARPEPAITASAPARQREERLSRKLASIDRDLRTRLQTAANAAMLRQLERAGARLRSKVAKDETMRTKIAHRANERAAAYAGQELLTAAGITTADLLTGDWSGLAAQFDKWTKAAQDQALRVATAMGATISDQTTARLATARQAAWVTMSTALGSLSEHLLYNPAPNATSDWGDLNADTLVPAGLVRAAIGVAGGAAPSTVNLGADGSISTSGFTGQIGTGDIISGVLSDAGGQTDEWQWDHAGSVQDPFEPHLDLDGTQFAQFDDEALANPGDFPPNEYLFPGDHGGCTCDAMPMWSFPGSPINPSDEE
jgi:hypothetical protein